MEKKPSGSGSADKKGKTKKSEKKGDAGQNQMADNFANFMGDEKKMEELRKKYPDYPGAQPMGGKEGKKKKKKKTDGSSMQGMVGMVGMTGIQLMSGGESMSGVEGWKQEKAPACKQFECGKDLKAVGILDQKLWKVGCAMSGSIYGRYTENADKCCVERDLCRQICGTPIQLCHDNFKKCIFKAMRKCTPKKKKEDDKSPDPTKMCTSSINIALMENEPWRKLPKGVDWTDETQHNEALCLGYNQGQNESCTCVGELNYENVVEMNLKAFYKQYNSKKLTKEGNLTEIDALWKKWRGKEPEMFLQLASKYADKIEKIDGYKEPDSKVFPGTHLIFKDENEKLEKEKKKKKSQQATRKKMEEL